MECSAPDAFIVELRRAAERSPGWSRRARPATTSPRWSCPKSRPASDIFWCTDAGLFLNNIVSHFDSDRRFSAGRPTSRDRHVVSAEIGVPHARLFTPRRVAQVPAGAAVKVAGFSDAAAGTVDRRHPSGQSAGVSKGRAGQVRLLAVAVGCCSSSPKDADREAALPREDRRWPPSRRRADRPADSLLIASSAERQLRRLARHEAVRRSRMPMP